MSKRRKNPRKRPTRTRRGRAMAAEKRRARAFWAMRRKTEREPAEPPEPAWFRIARIWAAALAAGYFAWTVVKWIMD